MSNNKDFVWTDELAAELLEFRKGYGNGYPTDMLVTHFKDKQEKKLKERVEVSHLANHSLYNRNLDDNRWYEFRCSRELLPTDHARIKQAIEAVLNPNTDTVFDHEKINKRLDELTEHEAAFNAAREMYIDSPDTPTIIKQSHSQTEHNFINLCKYKTFTEYSLSLREPITENKPTDTQVEKPVLFYTEDKTPIYEGDGTLNTVVFRDFTFNAREYHHQTIEEITLHGRENLKIFSSYEAANQYILQNKPCLSLNDLLEVWGEKGDYYKSAPLFLKFQEKAKQKLN